MKKYPKTRPPLPMLTAAAFKRAVGPSRISDENVGRARRVLVDGERVIEVAESDGVSRQRVYQVVERILAGL
ncbi:MAG: TrfB-related DNA-binding protein [Gammaproteobacteria bacterium]